MEVRARARELGLGIDLDQPFRDFEGVTPERLERNLRRAEAKFELMQRLGAQTVLVCSNATPNAIDDDALAAGQLRTLAERAARHGLQVAYEAPAWGTHVNEYDHVWRIVQAADHPALGVCLDSFHILSRGTGLATIDEIPAEKLLFLQLADAPHLVMDVLQWSRHYRCFPGQGGFDLAAFTRRVLAAGYTGPLSLEVFNDVFRQADPERMAVDAMRSLLILQEAVAADRDRPLPLPPPPALHGYAFAELAVEPASAGDTQWVAIVTNVVALAAIPAWATLADRIGRKPVFIFGAVGSGALMFAYLAAISSGRYVLIFMAAVLMSGIVYSAMNAITPSLFGEMFPTRVRLSGTAIGTQIGFAIGGFAPTAAAAIAGDGPAGWVPVAGYVLVSSLLAAVAIATARETHKLPLRELDGVEPPIVPAASTRRPSHGGARASGRG